MIELDDWCPSFIDFPDLVLEEENAMKFLTETQVWVL